MLTLKVMQLYSLSRCWICLLLTQSALTSSESFEGSADVGRCPRGTYASYQLCLECPAGHFCLGEVSAPRRCPAGTYNLHTGKSSITDCQSCSPGLISSEDRVDCRLCPSGFSCRRADGTLSPCPPGQHSPEGVLQCLACPDGSVCTSGYPHKCPPGQEPNSEQMGCDDCFPGFYSTVCTIQCLKCPVGSYCPDSGMSQPLPCPPGQTSLSGQILCHSCNETSPLCGRAATPPSWPVQRAGLLVACHSGTYKDTGEGTSCLICPLGHYCLGGLAVPCPAGTYGPKEGLQRLRDCPPCPAGFYCLEGSSRRPTSQFLCPQGYYCEEGTAVPHGSPCPAGTAGQQLGQTSRAACMRCGEGRFCPAGSVGLGLPCARGRYCPAGALQEVICPQGTFTPHQGAISVKDCLKCPAGFYCPPGTSDPVPCPSGTFNPLEGQHELPDCRACYPGKACTQVALRAPDVDCMQGFVCPPGSSKPNAMTNACPPGTLSNRTDLTDRSQCQRCPARYACLRGTGGMQRPPLSCFAGHYCPPGTMFPTQYKCPVGTWSGRSGLRAESECQPCPPGWYCLAGTGSPSGRCSSGHYCPQGTSYGSQFPCPAGTYSTRMGNGLREDCLMCPEGSYCRQGTSKPSPCPSSTFRRLKGGQRLEDCSACPAGYFCPRSATVSPRVCGAGSFSDEGSVECSPCLQGHYCSNETTSEEAMLSVMVCPPGFLCSQGLARDPQRSATLCPQGFYCPGGRVDPNPLPCPNGTYGGHPGLRDVNECVQCPQGKFCYSRHPQEQPVTEPTGNCPDGHYCPPGTGSPYTFPCQAGQYRNGTHGHTGAMCVPCPSRHYCLRPGMHMPLICPQGSYCPEGSSIPEPCPEGTYGSRPALGEKSECSPCGGGRYCTSVALTEVSGVCAEGFYCRGGAKSATPVDGLTGGLCPVGSYCPPASSSPSPCPPGTFSNSTGLSKPQQCVVCPPGSYCLGFNITTPSGLCHAGHYCTGGSSSPVQFEAEEGHYTSEGAVRPEPCPLGTFQPGRGGRSCVECQAGRLCNQTGLPWPPPCPAGHYCPQGTTGARPCPPGSYSELPGGVDAQHCRSCEAGWFCSQPGLSSPLGLCDPGHYCTSGASTASPVSAPSGGVCPAGYVCPRGTQHPRQHPCPVGTWSPAVGAQDMSSCRPCPPGLHCNSTGLGQPSGTCHPGYYCSGGAGSPMPADGVTGDKCPVEHYCPLGSTAPELCPDGTHSNASGASECEDCPPGTYCLSGEGVQLCPVGHYCLGGSVEGILPCPPGTYSPQLGLSHVEQCLICPAGMFCEDWGLFEPTGPCEAGYYCLAGMNFRNPDGNFSTGVGGACLPGRYCPEGTSHPLPCPLGTYSNRLHLTESSGCSPCPAGQFCGTVGLTHPSGFCQEGFYCPGGDKTPTAAEGNGGLCPPAHHCPGGSASPVPCPAGSYTNLTGQTRCSRCPAGYFCPEKTGDFTKFPCPPGFYCPDGTRHATQFPCPRGYYNPESMTQSLDSCLPCPPGRYCEKERLTKVSGKCKAGWFCVSAAWNSQPFDLDNYTNANCLCPATSTGGRCQEGFYCPSGSAEPLPCPPGAFCNISGLALPMGPCAAGYYCIGGATKARPTDGETGGICPPGTYCVEGSGEPELCPAGTFSAVPGLSHKAGCEPCTAGLYCRGRGLTAPSGPCSQGYWCLPGQSLATALSCPPGHFCPQGSASPRPCPPGTYQDHEKQASCSVCEPGYYCDLRLGLANDSVLRPCPKGHYCPAGTALATQNPCPMGSFNPTERSDSIQSCIPCLPGQYCPAVGLAEPAGPCQAGFWCRGGALSPVPLDGRSGLLCQPGQYCPSGAAAPVLCPAGSWSNGSGLRSQEDCRPCPGGHYCDSAGLAAPTGLCTGGYYCLGGAVTSTPAEGAAGGPCPEGHRCPGGTSQPVPCDPGTYVAVTHATQCEPCIPGWHCVSGSLYLCPAGYYCPKGTGYDIRGCPEGTYSPDPGHWSISQCRLCDGGHYCSSRNSTAVSGQCQEGYYCSHGSASPRPRSDGTGNGGPCPAGHYCPRASVRPLPCPRGTFSNLTKLASQELCQLCPSGSFCDNVGLTTPSGPCRAGFYCLPGAERPDPPSRDDRGGPCPRGYYCSEGSAVPQRCPLGTISSEERRASCSPCPQGFYCPGSNGSVSESFECPLGHYCPSGTWSRRQYPCPAGSINPHSSMVRLQDCLPCPPGWFCASPGQSVASGTCNAGFYCVSGSRSPSPEDGGLTGDGCPQGRYCPKGSSAPLPCPLGHYSNQTGNGQQSDCLPCPPGFLCARRGLSFPSHPCPAGAYCPRGGNGSSRASFPCSPGNMCPPGSSSQVPCPPGTYQSLPGQAECVTCPAGFYCPGLVDPGAGHVSGTHTPILCPKGHYCKSGAWSGVASPCPAGTSSVRMGVASAGGCDPCPPGRYCASPGLAASTGPCSPGYLCVRGSASPRPEGGPTGGRCSAGSYCPEGASSMLPCPASTFSSVEAAASMSVCQPCLPGHYCAEVGLSSPSGPCDPGFYCLDGSRTASPLGNTTSPSPPHDDSTLGQSRGDVCPAGYYCPSGSAQPSPCPPGTFLGRSGAVSEADCAACVQGSHCPSWAQTSADPLCPQGWFCPPGSASGHQPEFQCPPGHACPLGSAEPAPCSPGSFQSSSGQSTCQACPPGFYCTEGASLPSPCPPGSVNPSSGRTSLEGCSLCPSGSVCNVSALTEPSGRCGPGHFCSSGATEPFPFSQPYGDICPVGHFCPEGSRFPKPCPAGSFLQQPGATLASDCLPCPPGKYCLSPGASQPTGPCSPGFFCYGGADSPAPRAGSSLLSCLFGTLVVHAGEQELYLWTHNLSCFNCSSSLEYTRIDVATKLGPWTDLDLLLNRLEFCRNTSDYACPAQKGDICPRGFYCPLGSPYPQPCEAGSYCDSTGLAAPAGVCRAGYHCPRGSLEPHATPCPQGHYCPRGSPAPLPCPLGTIKSTQGGSTSEACRPCPPGHYCGQTGIAAPTGQCANGYFCPEGQTTGRPQRHICPVGYFCEKGSIRARPCLPGSFQPREGQGSCEGCPSGFYCQEQGMLTPVPCERGFYCNNGSANQHPCPVGTYGNQSGLAHEWECLFCDPGMYCKGTGRTFPSGPCAAGYVCLGGAYKPAPSDNLTGFICPPGAFCPVGTATPKPCPKGTFSEQSGLLEDSQCRSCSRGFYCSETGLSAVSGPCWPGFYCLEGSQSASPVSGVSGGLCPPGHYCPMGSSVPSPCPSGTYQNQTGGKGISDCKPCYHGWFQDLSGQRECKPCPPGYHCHNPTNPTPMRGGSGGVSSPLPCPAGYICPGDSPPYPCPLGTYSPSQGLTATGECLLCSAGQFCGAEGLAEPSGPCAAGFLCLIGATVPNPTDNRTGSACPPGFFCQHGLTAGDCLAGYYCDWGSTKADQTLCPAGFFCPRGTAAPLLCPVGTFSTRAGNTHQDNCTTCPAGHYCQGEGTVQPAPCPPGHYCPPGSTLGLGFPCPPGTVQNQPGAASLSACSPCPAGWFCFLPGLSQPTGLCEAGYVCPAGSTSPNSTEYQGNSTRNTLCPPGHYCPAGTGLPLPCPAGSLSVSPGRRGIEECPPCPPGLFCDHPALTEASKALQCHAGYVCKGGSDNPKPVDGRHGYLCPAGHSCPAGCVVEEPCEPGTYSPSFGKDHCLTCPEGTMCPSLAMRELSLCPPGHFCPAGTALPVPCPLGTLSNQTGAHSVSVCAACPPGVYCSSSGASTPDGPCEQGFYCHGGAVSPTPQSSDIFPRNGACPVGHYCPSGCLSPLPCPLASIRNISGAFSVEGCVSCPAGHYCATDGLATPSGPCAAGFYCPFDFSSTTPYAFICPKGHYCPERSPLALPCPTGEYQPNPGSSRCIPCRAGYYCEEAIIGDPWPCPPHSFCPAGTMVPHPCPNGTYTPPSTGGLQEERECLPCPPGRFCRAGKIQGACSAGYLCVSGSADFTPQGPVSNWSRCEWGLQCAGQCPPGFYCPEGIESPTACPPNTIRSSPGGSTRQDCGPCPPQHWCKPGDPMLHLCPAGHYCDGLAGSDYDGEAGPRECPIHTYRAEPGAGSKGDCHPCPPGSHCNTTGLTDFSTNLCPPGYWCSGTRAPVLCPAGTKRSHPGAAGPSQCELCSGGTFCPHPQTTGQPNIWGIPCRASFQCPPGAVSEKPCRAGSYCGPQTSEPPVCPEGYFCPEGSQTYSVSKQLCLFPYFCPANSSSLHSCDGGSMPVNTSGLRGSKRSCCRVCEEGTYRPRASPTTHCLPCPAGYFCPRPAKSYDGNPCPLGHVCPLGAAKPLPCPPGSFGNITRAAQVEGCHPCPAGTFNHLPAQKACFPCGSSSTSTAGSSSCTCIGENRAFQHSDGSCVCRTGLIFYNKLDFKSSSSDSVLDCQPEVNRRCAAGQVRLAASRECTIPSLYSCNVTCGPHGGTLDVEMGICQCEHYVFAEELCNSSCLSRLPQLSAQLSPDGQLILTLKRRGRSLGVSNRIDVLGPDIHMKSAGKVHFVQFDAEGLFGWIFTDSTLISRFLSESEEDRARNNRDTEPKWKPVHSVHPPRVPNPIACLSSGDMLIFQLTINHTDRSRSHFPVYQKDHLFNSNPGWDFGAFRHLQILIKQTHFNATRFAHVFTETGKYVLVDNAVPEWSMVVVVSEEGTECDPRAAVFQPMTPAQLVRLGIVKQHQLNLLPNWGVIVGVLSVLLLLVVILTSTALVLRPSNVKLVSHRSSKPRWRSLGEPRRPMELLHNGDSAELVGSRGVGEGAESEEPSVSKSGHLSERCELEEFNVKTLYDKLEDQNLHLASQLARHRKDMQEFYRNICQQMDSLQNILENMDGKKMNLFKALCHDTMREQRSEQHTQADAAVALLGAVLGSAEALIYRLTGEGWQSQDLLTPANCPAEASECHLQSLAPSLSDQDLSKLVTISPLYRTLHDIQQSLQNLTSAEPVVIDLPVRKDPVVHLVPVALDNLSPQHSAIFRFGCHVMRLLGNCSLFPHVLLLLAKSLPASSSSPNDGLLAHCSKDFYFDGTNQILYLSEAELQHAGQFIATILQSMAYIASGSKPQSFMQALRQAISALSLQLFNTSFQRDATKSVDTSETWSGAFVEDFLHLRIPSEEHFAEHLLASRLKKYEFFKLEQLIRDLKREPTQQTEAGLFPKSVPAHVSCIEDEIDCLNESFLQLSIQLQKKAEMSAWRQERQRTSSGAETPAPSRGGATVLELKRRCVSQRLDELQNTSERIRRRPQDGGGTARRGRGKHSNLDDRVTPERPWQKETLSDRSQSRQAVESSGPGNDIPGGRVSDQGCQALNPLDRNVPGKQEFSG